MPTSSVLSNLGRRLFYHDHFTSKKTLSYIDIHNSQVIIRATLVTSESCEMDRRQEADQECWSLDSLRTSKRCWIVATFRSM